jgi:hypothetical protein
MKPSELLRKGAEEIKRRGWTQLYFGSDPNKPHTCQVCAIGGLRAAATGDPFENPRGVSAFSRARMFLLNASGDGSIVDWNDTEGRTEAEVLDLFERAAIAAEAKGLR